MKKSAGKNTNNRGFSLVDTMIGLFLFSLFVIGVVQLGSFVSGQANSARARNNKLQSKTFLTRTLEKDFRTAGYNFVAQNTSRIGEREAKFAPSQEYSSSGSGEVRRLTSGESGGISSSSYIQGVPAKISVRMPRAAIVTITDEAANSLSLQTANSKVYLNSAEIAVYDPLALYRIDYQVGAANRIIKIIAVSQSVEKEIFQGAAPFTGNRLRFQIFIDQPGDSAALRLSGLRRSSFSAQKTVSPPLIFNS